MNLQLRETPQVQIYGARALLDYEIEQDPSIFPLFSDKIYSDPILAVVREYLTNAWDSHKLAGNTHTPVEIILETDPPRFAIRDQGIGMDYDDMDRVFRRFFNSTKRDKDFLNGTFGIGSKVAFAFVDQFNATGWKNGRRHAFANYLKPNRHPGVAVMTPVPDGAPSDEPTGVLIDVPIADRNDIPKLRRVAEMLLRVSTINARLIVDGVEIPVDGSFGRALATHGFGYSMSALGSTRSLHVVQGEVPYPAGKTIERAKNHPPFEDLFLHAPARAFEYPVSREELRKTAATERRLAEMLANAHAAIAAAYTELIATAADRLPIANLYALRDPNVRKRIFTDLIGQNRSYDIFCGPRGAALYLGMSGQDSRYFDSAMKRVAERRFRRRFKTPELADAAIKRSLMREYGRVAAIVLAANRAAPPDAPAICLYSRDYTAETPQSKFSRALVHVDPVAAAPRFFGFRPPAPDKDAPTDARKRQAIDARAIADLMIRLTAHDDGVSLIARSVRLRTLFVNGAGLAGSGIAVQFAPKDVDPLTVVDPALVAALTRATGRSRIVIDRLDHLAGRPKPVRRPKDQDGTQASSAKQTPLYSVAHANTSHHRGGAKKLSLSLGRIAPQSQPVAFVRVTQAALQRQSYQTSGQPAAATQLVANLINALRKVIPHGVAAATTNSAATAFAAEGLTLIPCDLTAIWNESQSPAPARDIIMLAGELLALQATERALLYSNNTGAVIIDLYLESYRRRFGRDLAADVRKHIAEIVAVFGSRDGATAADKAAITAWKTFTERYPLLAPRWSDDEAFVGALQKYFELIDASHASSPVTTEKSR